jgi:hypothetical protein
MKRKRTQKAMIVLATAMVGCLAILPALARAHCDTLGGPVVKEARVALEKGDIKPILKWVKKENEAELRTAFDKTLAVRSKGPEARELADLYFLETLVRLHRAGEGAPYTGLKDEPLEPIVAMADKALAEGSDREMIKAISAHMASAIHEKFKKAAEAMKNQDVSIDAGREFVEAYVTYMHYVEAVHAAIVAAGGDHH